jgi:hypothetical protein
MYQLMFQFLSFEIEPLRKALADYLLRPKPSLSPLFVDQMRQKK